MQKLKFHPKARENFNKISEEIYNDLIILKKDNVKSKKPINQSKYITQIDPKDIIGEITLRSVNYFGERKSIKFSHKDDMVKIDENNYKKLRILSEKITMIKENSPFVSKEYVEEKIIDWIHKKLNDSSFSMFIDYLSLKADDDIQEHIIWIPLPSIIICSDIKIGEVTLKKFDDNFCDYWKQNQVVQFGELKKIHNQTFASIIVIAEPIKAKELAKNKIEATLSLLSLFSPAAFDPRALSYCSIYSKNTKNSLELWELDNTYKKLTSSESLVFEGSPFWQIDETFKKIIESVSPLINSLLNSPLISFQKDLFDAIVYFSKSTLVSDFSDKLVYILVALETLLLNNSSPPILETVSRRLAFFLGKDIDGRKRIMKNFKDTYTLRSKFIHHGKTIQDIETFKEFLDIARLLFLKLLTNQKKYSSIQELIDEIEDRSLS